jgi:RNA polymerase-interacting CarD/CdnL/TRCF family regulator
MNFQVGETVIHTSYGLAEIVAVEEKAVADQKLLYYVVKASDLTVWIPINDLDNSHLRHPTSKDEFTNLFSILRSKSDPLSGDRKERKAQLMERIKEGNSASLCRLVRDLADFRLTKKLNENDNYIFKRAQDSLLKEWIFSLSVPLAQAKNDLKKILDEKSVQASA